MYKPEAIAPVRLRDIAPRKLRQISLHRGEACVNLREDGSVSLAGPPYTTGIKLLYLCKDGLRERIERLNADLNDCLEASGALEDMALADNEKPHPDPLVRLTGLHLGEYGGGEWLYYDIGLLAYHALEAMQLAVLAFQQIVTGEKLVNSLDIGDFYTNISSALAEKNGEGVLSEPGDMPSIQDEIQGLINLVQSARRIAKRPRKGLT